MKPDREKNVPAAVADDDLAAAAVVETVIVVEIEIDATNRHVFEPTTEQIIQEYLGERALKDTRSDG